MKLKKIVMSMMLACSGVSSGYADSFINTHVVTATSSNCNVLNSVSDDDRFVCAVGKDIIGSPQKLVAHAFEAVMPVNSLVSIGLSKLKGLIWGKFMPQPAYMQDLQEILELDKEILAVDQTIMATLNNEFDKTDALIEAIFTDAIKVQAAKFTNAIGSDSKASGLIYQRKKMVTAMQSSDYLDVFTTTLKNAPLPPSAVYPLIPSKLLDPTDVSGHGKALVISSTEKNTEISGKTKWQTSGSNPFTFSLVNGDAVITEGKSGAKIFSAKQLYEASNIGKTAPSFTKVSFEDAQLKFYTTGSGSTAEKVVFSVGITDDILAESGITSSSDPSIDNVRTLYSTAVLNTDGSLSVYAPPSYSSGTQAATMPLPYTSLQNQLLTQWYFLGLQDYENANTDKTSIRDAIAGMLNDASVALTGNSVTADAPFDIVAVTNALTDTLQQIYTEMGSVMSTLNVANNNGQVSLQSNDNDVELLAITQRYLQLYTAASTILNYIAQATMYEFYYWEFTDSDTDQLAAQFTAAQKKLNTSFYNALTNFGDQYVWKVTANGLHTGQFGSVGVYLLPGVQQYVTPYTSSDGIATVILPFETKAAINIENYEQVLSTGNLAALGDTSLIDSNFVCAIAGSYTSTDGKTVDCSDYKNYSGKAQPQNFPLSQLKFLNYAFANLPSEPVDNTQNSGFAKIVSLGKDSASGNYQYQVTVRMSATETLSSSSSVTYYQDFINNQIMVNPNIYNGFMEHISPVGSALPKGSWSAHCALPKADFGGMSDSSRWADVTYLTNADPRASFKVSCAYSKSADPRHGGGTVKVWSEQSIVPASCVAKSQDGQVKLDDIYIDYDVVSHQLVCATGHNDPTNQVSDYYFIQSNLMDESDSALLKMNHHISCSADFITALATGAGSANKPSGYSAYIMSKAQNFNHTSGLKAGSNYCDLGARNSSFEKIYTSSNDGANGDGDMQINKGGYIWASMKYLPESVKVRMAGGNWKDYCSQPYLDNFHLVADCGGATYRVGNDLCLAMDMQISDQTIGEMRYGGQLYCVDPITDKPAPSSLALYLESTGKIAPSLRGNYDAASLGLVHDKRSITFNTTVDGNLINTPLVYDPKNVYRLNQATGKVEIAPWSGACGAYLYNTLDPKILVVQGHKWEGDAPTQISCASYDLVQDKLVKTNSIMAKEDQKNDYYAPIVPQMCDLSFVGLAQQGAQSSMSSYVNLSKDERNFLCHSYDEYKNKINDKWYVTVKAETPSADEPYTRYIVYPNGHAILHEQEYTGYVNAPGTYFRKCPIVRSVVIGDISPQSPDNEYPTHIYATCITRAGGSTYDNGYHYNSKWDYSGKCELGSKVSVDDNGVLQCDIEKGAPKIDDSYCQLDTYRNGKITVSCDALNEDGDKAVRVALDTDQYETLKGYCGATMGRPIVEVTSASQNPDGTYKDDLLVKVVGCEKTVSCGDKKPGETFTQTIADFTANYLVVEDGNGQYGIKNPDVLKAIIDGTQLVCTSHVTDMSRLFKGVTTEIKQVLETWDTSNVTNMSRMFNEAKAFNQDIRGWDTRKVTDMSSMFLVASSFNQPIGDWNTQNVTDMNSMFDQATVFNQDISRWDTSKVTNMAWMFKDTNAFNQDLSDWDTSKVTNMAYMFEKALAFNQPIGDWDTSKVTNMYEMFYDATAFNQSIVNWKDDSLENCEKILSTKSALDKDNQPEWMEHCMMVPRCPTDEYKPGDKARYIGIDYLVVTDGSGDYGIKNTKVLSAMMDGSQPICTTQVTDMSHLFSGITDPISDAIRHWDTSNVTNMRYMFRASSFNGPIGDWDTGNVTDMTGMFEDASAFNQPLDKWDTSKVTDMNTMFDRAAAFNQDLSDWDTSNVTNMAWMFQSAIAFNQPIGAWDTSNVTDMSYMFKGTTTFNQPIGDWDTSKVTNMYEMFYDATAFNQSIVNWKDDSLENCMQILSTKSVLEQNNQPAWMSHCAAIRCPAVDGFKLGDKVSFNGTDYLVVGDGTGDYGIKNTKVLSAMMDGTQPICTTQVTDMSHLFSGITDPISDAIGHWDTSNVTNMSAMFSDSSFNGSIGDWDTSKVTDMNSMFEDASKFNQSLGKWDTSKVTDMNTMFDRATAFNQDLSDWDTSKVTNMAWMFKGATAFNQPIDDWDTSQVTNMHEMFYDATAFNQPLGKWDTSKVTTMSAMFQGASHFNQDIGKWDTSKVTNMNSMFDGAAAFNQNISGWNTENVTDMGFMFKEADVFNQKIGNWNTSNVTNMRAMFQRTNHFNQNLSKWDTKKVTDISFMFDHAIAFNSPLFVSTDNVTKMEATFTYAKSLDTDQAHALSDWKTDKVEIFDNMFRDTHVEANITKWNHANTYTCYGMLEYSSMGNTSHKASWMSHCPENQE